MEFNPDYILREYNPTIGNITLLEYNPRNFRVIFQFRVKFPVFELFRVKFQKCYFPKVLYSHASIKNSRDTGKNREITKNPKSRDLKAGEREMSNPGHSEQFRAIPNPELRKFGIFGISSSRFSDSYPGLKFWDFLI